MTEQHYAIYPRLRDLIKDSKYGNQKEFAKATGLGEPTISRFDSQKRYDIYTLVVISRALGKTIDDLFDVHDVILPSAEDMNEIINNHQ